MIGGYKVRTAGPWDLDAIEKLHKEQNERDGTNYPLPTLFHRSGRFASGIAQALVVEHKNEVRQAIYFERAGVEMCFAGCDPKATAAIRHEQDAVLYTLRGLGYEWIRTMIPLNVVDLLERPLKASGFRRDDGKLASFFREI